MKITESTTYEEIRNCAVLVDNEQEFYFLLYVAKLNGINVSGDFDCFDRFNRFILFSRGMPLVTGKSHHYDNSGNKASVDIIGISEKAKSFIELSIKRKKLEDEASLVEFEIESLFV